jgi:hypothetical protein
MGHGEHAEDIGLENRKEIRVFALFAAPPPAHRTFAAPLFIQCNSITLKYLLARLMRNLRKTPV